ncbi:UNVERIFIED_CONTAM: hypothetical protein GTU68_064275 [Idotea baltica]|nr:hypothetical protein [Idotea baltica]
MKLITAIIRESQLDQVREALIEASIARITVSRVSGHGRQRNAEIHRGRKVVPSLVPKIKVEIALNDSFVDIAVDTIMKAVRNSKGIDNTELELIECIRIRTDERGSTAI